MNSMLVQAARRAARVCAMVLACALGGAGSAAADERYRFTGYLDGGTTVDRGIYSVLAPRPRGVLRAGRWRHFEDRVDPDNVIRTLRNRILAVAPQSLKFSISGTIPLTRIARNSYPT